MTKRINKDQPSTWTVYKSILCLKCHATCCTMPLEVRIEDLARLGFLNESEIMDYSKKDFQRLIRELKSSGVIKNYRESTKLFLMASKANGDCQYLDSNRHCTVYDKRPGVCREFPQRMGLRKGFCPYIPKANSK